ncbi:hypothetical protein [Streptococcus loxodontisalivarius]|uniref:Uncharacterized protein n=1 Tax=Streptococcus loxodontisalivarius TaxID=1349415 RepID=A0ABS2PUI6_9STRE|nr:hypothetical protein [Streptococcus loxodontisalivarius]MBM7643726.1 hypothetical protein [Streptococcus loxodontisalivarius]
MKLTFNLSDLVASAINMPSPNNHDDISEWVRTVNRKEISLSDIKISSGMLRSFIEETFGIGFDLAKHDHASHNRNQLNKLIKQVTSTERAKKTVLDFYEYKALLELEEFSRFIIKRMEIDFLAEDQTKLYNELMFLQAARYEHTYQYKQDKKYQQLSIAYALSRFPNFADAVRAYYCLYIERYNVDYPINEQEGELLEIIHYRYIQNDPSVYKYETTTEVAFQDDVTILYDFLEDVDRWDRRTEDVTGSYVYLNAMISKLYSRADFITNWYIKEIGQIALNRPLNDND